MANIKTPRLDDLYKMVAYIYGDKLSSRSTTSTFTHLVEVCGMLTIHDRNKKREGLDVTDILCKVLGWYLPLLAKFKVRSVEALVFRKFPRVCPYCREAPHNEANCKLVKGTSPTVKHKEVEDIYRDNWSTRPVTLNDWQQMFQDIYPRQLTDRGRSSVGMLEELGELAEAVRVAEAHPKYLLGEAADLFSYIMGIANEHALRLAQEEKEFSFQDEFLRRYPGLCTQCGYKICVCPSIPEATVGRMAKELNIRSDERPFIDDAEGFAREGEQIAHDVLELLGGYNGLTAHLPLDRGDTNRALVLLCNGIAEAVELTNGQLAASLRAEAYKIGVNARSAGTARQPLNVEGLLQKIGEAWTGLSYEQKKGIKSDGGKLIQEFGDILDARRVLFVYCTPQDEGQIRAGAELRVIRQSVEHGPLNVIVDDLPAATVDDLRTKLLRSAQPYQVIHFAGHADGDVLVFEDNQGNATPVPLTAIADLLYRQKAQCVILNACSSAHNLTKAIAPYTIGMKEEIDDEDALEFSRGFYDALSAGKAYDDAYLEGVSAVNLKGGQSDTITLLTN
jgi:hypothetical protein